MSVIFLEVFLRFLPVCDSMMTMAVNSENPYLRYKENREVTYSVGYDFSIVAKKRTNNYGFFSDYDYHPEAESPLLAVIGDSYVEALQVENIASMHGILAEKAKGKGRVYSFGSSGSPLSNYLAYANFATNEFDADALVFIIISNDFDQSLIKYSAGPLGMHRFTDASGGLELVRQDYHPSLLKRLLRPSALARYLVRNLGGDRLLRKIMRLADRNGSVLGFIRNTRAASDAERVADSKRVIDKFFDELPVQTSLSPESILFVIDGMRPHLYDAAKLEKASGSYFDLMRDYFSTTAAARGYEIIDMQPTFVRESRSKGSRFEFPTDRHWNTIGHALVAAQIEKSALFSSLFGR